MANLLNKGNGPADINNLSVGRIYSSKNIIEHYSGYYLSELTAEESNELRVHAFRKLSESSDDGIFIKTHDAFTTNVNNEHLFPLECTKACIYFIRNPLDVVVSFSNHLASDIEKVSANICNDNFVLGLSRKKYIIQTEQKLLSWSGHVKSWTEQHYFPVIVIRYEDILEDCGRYFRKILHFLDIEFDEKNFNRALKYSSFEVLQKTEDEVGFKEKPVNCHKFFNTGKKGYFYDYLARDNINLIIEKNKDVMADYGYLNENGDITI